MKVAANFMGGQVSIWDRVSSLLVVAFLIFFFSGKSSGIFTSFPGIFFGLLSGVIAGVASYLFFVFFSKNPVSWVVAVTALYPLVTIVLSMIFLHERLNIREWAGVAFGMIALYFLSGG